MQASPGRAGGQVDHDYPVRARVRRVGDVGDPRLAAPQVEPDVVEVRRRQRHVGREGDHLGDGVGVEVDPHQLRPARLRGLEHRTAGVHDPQPVGRVDDDALHRDERVGVVVAGRGVPLLVGEGHLRAVAQLDHRGRDLVAPLREVDEDPAGVRHAHPGRHRPGERVHELQRADRLGTHRPVHRWPRRRGSTEPPTWSRLARRSSVARSPSTTVMGAKLPDDGGRAQGRPGWTGRPRTSDPSGRRSASRGPAPADSIRPRVTFPPIRTANRRGEGGPTATGRSDGSDRRRP